MLRFLASLYASGTIVFFVLFLIFVPRITVVDALVAALLWPWGVYKYFIQGGVLS